MKVTILQTVPLVEINHTELEVWLQALESGEYKQGRMSLQIADKFCCLGVAVKVLVKEEDQMRTMCPMANQMRLMGAVPSDQPKSPDWLREMSNDLYIRSKNTFTLTGLNDHANVGFKDIARILRKVYQEGMDIGHKDINKRLYGEHINVDEWVRLTEEANRERQMGGKV